MFFRHTDTAVFFCSHSHSRANEARGRGWENGGLKRLVRGVALLIGGDTTRARLREDGMREEGSRHHPCPYLQVQVGAEMERNGEKRRGSDVDLSLMWL